MFKVEIISYPKISVLQKFLHQIAWNWNLFSKTESKTSSNSQKLFEKFPSQSFQNYSKTFYSKRKFKLKRQKTKDSRFNHLPWSNHSSQQTKKRLLSWVQCKNTTTKPACDSVRTGKMTKIGLTFVRIAMVAGQVLAWNPTAKLWICQNRNVFDMV